MSQQRQTRSASRNTRQPPVQALAAPGRGDGRNPVQVPRRIPIPLLPLLLEHAREKPLLKWTLPVHYFGRQILATVYVVDDRYCCVIGLDVIHGLALSLSGDTFKVTWSQLCVSAGPAVRT